MEITDIKFRHMTQEGRLRAMVSVTFDHVLAVHDIKIIQGQDRLFLAMPSRRMPDGRYRDIAHPVGSTLREQLEQRVLDAYHDSLSEQGVCENGACSLGDALPYQTPAPEWYTVDTDLLM